MAELIFGDIFTEVCGETQILPVTPAEVEASVMHFTNRWTVSEQYCHQNSVRSLSLNLLAVPSTSVFFGKKRLTTGEKYCERRRADMSFRFQQFVLKSNDRGDEVV